MTCEMFDDIITVECDLVWVNTCSLGNNHRVLMKQLNQLFTVMQFTLLSKVHCRV